jgi:mediator of RNA polymerase II transcription subunit 17
MTDIGPGSVPVSLRPWPTEDPGSEDLQLQLQRLYQRRGHFRHITEEGLQEEINNAEDGPVNVMEGVENTETLAATGEKERRAEIYTAKAQMQQLIG